MVARDAETRVETPRLGLIIPPSTFFGQGVAVRVRSLPSEELPQLPTESIIVRGIQLDTMAYGVETKLPFAKQITLEIPLTEQDIALAGGDPSVLQVLRFNTQTQVWDVLDTKLVEQPSPHLVASLPGFSYFAVTAPRETITTPAPVTTAQPTPINGTTATPVPPVSTPTPAEEPESGGLPLILIVGAVVFALLSGSALVVYLQSRKRPA